jgi:hypothetical protein
MKRVSAMKFKLKMVFIVRLSIESPCLNLCDNVLQWTNIPLFL